MYNKCVFYVIIKSINKINKYVRFVEINKSSDI